MSRSALAVAVQDSIPEQAPPLPIALSPLKRAIDVVGSIALLLATSPLFALIALAIRLDSPGPVLFRQERCGYRGRRFVVLKFRSMRNDAEDTPHREYVRALIRGVERTNEQGTFKLQNDARVTRVGRLLRRTSLDELPQLWNVLRGEMSLVGPRPPLPYEVELYDTRTWRRLECKPGLTGLWQVSGRNQLSYRSMCELDLEYIDRWSHALDISILLRTVPVVFRNSGSAQ